MLKFLAGAAAMIVYSATAYAGSSGAKPNPFGPPNVEYMRQFVGKAQRTFVYERFDAKGVLIQRDVTALFSPVGVVGATERIMNGSSYRLRGLSECPESTVTYQAEKWDCQKAAVDYATAVYARSSIVLCKTLVLRTEKGRQDPVSCFALLGASNAIDPYTIYYDDDAMVFLGLAAIGKTSDGQSLRPDLTRSQTLGVNFQ